MSAHYDSCTITYRGVDFEVAGKWTPMEPATRDEPTEGGYYEDVTIEHNGHDWYEHLSELAVNNIITAFERNQK